MKKITKVEALNQLTACPTYFWGITHNEVDDNTLSTKAENLINYLDEGNLCEIRRGRRTSGYRVEFTGGSTLNFNSKDTEAYTDANNRFIIIKMNAYTPIKYLYYQPLPEKYADTPIV